MYYTETPGDSLMYGPAIGNSTFAPFTGLTPSLQILNIGDQHFTNFDQCGAIFTGLNPQTTLTVNYRLFVEVFPGSSSVLSNFSKPSPLADKFALELYSEICHKSPVGVEVKFNGLGDWFIDGINAVKDTVMPMVAKITKGSSHPYAMAANALANGLTKQKEKEKKDKLTPKERKALTNDIPVKAHPGRKKK